MFLGLAGLALLPATQATRRSLPRFCSTLFPPFCQGHAGFRFAHNPRCPFAHSLFIPAAFNMEFGGDHQFSLFKKKVQLFLWWGRLDTWNWRPRTNTVLPFFNGSLAGVAVHRVLPCLLAAPPLSAGPSEAQIPSEHRCVASHKQTGLQSRACCFDRGTGKTSYRHNYPTTFALQDPAETSKHPHTNL